MATAIKNHRHLPCWSGLSEAATDWHVLKTKVQAPFCERMLRVEQGPGWIGALQRSRSSRWRVGGSFASVLDARRSSTARRAGGSQCRSAHSWAARRGDHRADPIAGRGRFRFGAFRFHIALPEGAEPRTAHRRFRAPRPGGFLRHGGVIGEAVDFSRPHSARVLLSSAQTGVVLRVVSQANLCLQGRQGGWVAKRGEPDRQIQGRASAATSAVARPSSSRALPAARIPSAQQAQLPTLDSAGTGAQQHAAQNRPAVLQVVGGGRPIGLGRGIARRLSSRSRAQPLPPGPAGPAGRRWRLNDSETQAGSSRRFVFFFFFFFFFLRSNVLGPSCSTPARFGSLPMQEAGETDRDRFGDAPRGDPRELPAAGADRSSE